MNNMNSMNNLKRAGKRIEDEIRKYKALHYRFTRRLSQIAIQPVYETLSSKEKGGNKYYSEIWYEGDVRRSRYLGGENNPEVKAIKEKHFLSKAVKMLDRRIAGLEKCSDELETFDCGDVNDALPKTYRLTEEHLKKVAGMTEEEKWYAEALKEKAEMDAKFGISYETELSHKAKDGTRTRSKSEVSIANEFFERGKPYIYEMPTHIGPFILHPDFTFYSNRYNKVIMWEHAGLLGDPDYMQSFSERTDRYIRAGITPCVDVIFSFDTMLGDIDAGMIKTLLDEYE